MAAVARVPKAPDGLRDRGRRFWRSVNKAYGLTESERELLIEVCRTLDHLDELEEAIARDGVMTTGSTGQPVVHPAVAEARGQRTALHRLLAALALPDEDGQTIKPAELMRAQTAAAARWAGHTKDAG